MAWLTILLLGSLPVAVGDALLETLHTYDIEHYDVAARVEERGVAIRCTLRLKVLKPGPLRFLISPELEGLEVRRGPEGPLLPAELGAGPLDEVLKRVARGQAGLPTLLTVGPPGFKAGEQVDLSLAYRWRPSGAGLAYASGGGVQTHLSGFWLPTMGDELFTASVRVTGDGCYVATGVADGEGGFRTSSPAQVLCVAGGRFDVHATEVEGRRYELWSSPDHIPEDPDALLADLAAVLAQLESWFGPLERDRFVLIVEPRPQPSPSYCAQSFVCVHRAALPDARGRQLWLSHLAHECSHLWFGHRLATPVIGRGGTWLREGLAQWAGIRTAGTLLDEEAERRLWRANVRGYLGRVDLRRAEREPEVLFANEVTLMDATYLDPPVVPYLRGALVFRRLEHEVGPKKFRAALRALMAESEGRFVTGADLARKLGVEALVHYYAETTRLPNLELSEVKFGTGHATARITCRDASWPGGNVPCSIQTDRGEVVIEVRVSHGEGKLVWTGAGTPTRIQLDPERLHLDVLHLDVLGTPADPHK